MRGRLAARRGVPCELPWNLLRCECNAWDSHIVQQRYRNSKAELLDLSSTPNCRYTRDCLEDGGALAAERRRLLPRKPACAREPVGM